MNNLTVPHRQRLLWRFSENGPAWGKPRLGGRERCERLQDFLIIPQGIQLGNTRKKARQVVPGRNQVVRSATQAFALIGAVLYIVAPVAVVEVPLDCFT